MQHDIVLKKKLNFDLSTTSAGWDGMGEGSCISRENICYHVSANVILFNLICNMAMFKKLDFDLLTPSSGSRGGVGGKGDLQANNWYDVAAFVIFFFNFIRNMTMF